jgi:outer membrane protein assembly factor BamD (BamD/ComL family)
MMKTRCSVTALLVAAITIVATTTAFAQESRLRTLTYDPADKSWIETPPPAPGTPEGDIHTIRSRIKAGKFGAALKGLTGFVEVYGESDSLYPQTLILQAEALVGQKKFEPAHEILQTFLARFSGMRLTDEALRLEFVIAENFLKGAKRKAFVFFKVSGFDLAYEILDQIAADYPDSRIAVAALKAKGDHLFKVGDHALAEIEYARILRQFPQSRYHELALSRTAQSALASFGGVEYDEAALIEAEERFNDYGARYPASARRDGVDLIIASIHELQAEKQFRIAQYYERSEHPDSAIFYYRTLRTTWPESVAAQKATTRLELLGVADVVASNATLTDPTQP